VVTAVTSTPFGRLSDGRTAFLYTLTNAAGAHVTFTDFGAALVSAHMPDKDGKLGPVVLGFDSVAQYEDNPAYIGPVIGPVANRISGAEFLLAGQIHSLDDNEGQTCLHSGKTGWHKKLWAAEETPQGLSFTYETPENAGGFPGVVNAQIDVSLDESCRLTYHLQARTTAPTPIAMTRHEYFNLTDGGASPVRDHRVQINSMTIAAQDVDNCCNGDITPLSNHPKDLRQITALSDTPRPLSFDDHYIVGGDALRHMARVESPASGRRLDVFGTADGVQFYSGQALPVCDGREGIKFGPSHGFAIEAQARPNAVNLAHFPSIVLQPDQTYLDTIIYQFGLID
jgi:aldose 1-epimerase